MRPERFHRLRSVLERRQPDLTVLMERVNKAHNLSAILRSCDAVGVLEAHAVPPPGGLELHHHASGGTAKWMRVREHPDVEAAGAHLREAGFRIVAAHPVPGAADFREVDFTGPTALLVGAELYGVSEAGLDAADQAAVIPMEGMVRSLNVSVATALLLFEAQRQRRAAGMYASSRLEPEVRDRILFEWAYPRIAERLGEQGLPYPELGPDGELPSDLTES